MQSLEELMQAISAHEDIWDCLQECDEALRRGLVINIYGGYLSVKDAIDTYRIRALMTQNAGVETCGFERTLENLELRRSDEMLRGDALKTADKLFVLFRSQSTRELIGCIRVTESAEPHQMINDI